jgi:hypothetical protein
MTYGDPERADREQHPEIERRDLTKPPRIDIE